MSTREAVDDMRKAIRCLYLAVDRGIADDVAERFEAVLAALSPEESEVVAWEVEYMTAHATVNVVHRGLYAKGAEPSKVNILARRRLIYHPDDVPKEKS